MSMEAVKKSLAMFLVLVMCLALFPISAYAGEAEEGTGAESAAVVLLTEEGEKWSEPEEAESTDAAADDEEVPAEEASVTEGPVQEAGSEEPEEERFVERKESRPEMTEQKGEEEPASEEPAEEAAEEEPATEGAAEEVRAAGEASEQEPAVDDDPAAEPQEPNDEEPASEPEAGEELKEEDPTEESALKESAAEEPAEPVHEHEYTAAVTKPTCTEKGFTTFTCACGESYVDEYTNALNHPEVVDIPEVSATETETGKTSGKQCTLCGEILEGCEEIPVLEKPAEKKSPAPLNAKGKDAAAKEAKDAKLAAPILTEAFNSATGVRVSWKAVSGAAKYRLLRKNLTKGETAWSNVGETKDLTLIDKTAVSAQRYTYSVRAIDAGGTAGFCDETGRTCTYIAKSDITEIKSVSNGVSLRWSKPAGAKNFRVMRKTDGGTWKVIAVIQGTSYVDKEAPKGEKLWYTVRGVSMDNTVLINSFNGTGWSVYYLTAPVLTEAFNSATGVRVSWKTVNGSVKYRLLRKNVTKGETGWTNVGETAELTLIDKSAVSGQRYTYTVRTIAPNGKAGPCDEAGRTCTYIAMAKITKLESISDGVKLTWSKPNGAKNFRVFRKTDGSSTWKAIKDIQATTWIDKTTQKNVKYWYTVRSITLAADMYINSYNATGWSIQFTPANNKIGIAMPSSALQRWSKDGSQMKSALEKAGYTVDLRYGDNNVITQVSQIENMISGGCGVLIVAAIDGGSLGSVLAQAKQKGIPVIAYDRLIMDSDAVSYYVTFDNWLVGVKQGEYIRDALNLKTASGPFNIEFITGDPNDSNIHFFYDGAMSVLQPYLNSGKLVCRSGQIDKSAVTTPGWSPYDAQTRFENIIAANYSNGTPLHAVLASNDSTALGVENALASSYRNSVYPVITGQDCDISIMNNLIEGRQAMSVFKDTSVLAAKAAEMAGSLARGTAPSVNDTETYNNGSGIIPSYLCEPTVCTADNYEEVLIDSGFYTREDLS